MDQAEQIHAALQKTWRVTAAVKLLRHAAVDADPDRAESFLALLPEVMEMIAAESQAAADILEDVGENLSRAPIAA